MSTTLRQQASLHSQLATKLEEAAAIEEQLGTATVTVTVTAPKTTAAKKTAATGKKRGRPAGSKNKDATATATATASTPASTGTGRGRRNGPKSMKEMVVAALKGKKKGLGLPDIVSNVLASGYETNSKSPVNVVYQAVYKLMKDENVGADSRIVKDGSNYKLQEAA
jgi:hypothetical protein